MELKIIKITKESKYLKDLVNLELLLWPDHEFDELYNETMNSKDNYFCTIINDDLVAFMQISIKTDYVNGSTTSPVGYIEGVYVKEEHRNKGIARQLLMHACEYLKKQGIKEMASDVLIDNIDSQKFHESLGFIEAERVVNYIKKI